MVATVPVRMMRFSSKPSRPVTSATASSQRHLHLGERRDRHPDRQVVVEHVVLAHIGVGQHVVAERLACCAGPAQWPSISQACGRSTAMWSVIVLALDGPTPMLTMVMPPWPGLVR